MPSNCPGCVVSCPLSMEWVVLRAPELAKPAFLQIPVVVGCKIAMNFFQILRHLCCVLLCRGIPVISNSMQGMLQGALFLPSRCSFYLNRSLRLQNLLKCHFSFRVLCAQNSSVSSKVVKWNETERTMTCKSCFFKKASTYREHCLWEL